MFFYYFPFWERKKDKSTHTSNKNKQASQTLIRQRIRKGIAPFLFSSDRLEMRAKLQKHQKEERGISLFLVGRF